MKEETLKKIEIENYIWILYLVIIGLSFFANSLEKDFIINNDIKSKDNYRITNIIIFSIVLLVYFYFTYENYKDLKSLNCGDSYKKIKLTNLEFIGSFLVLISGIIFLYCVYEDTDIETEIAFN